MILAIMVAGAIVFQALGRPWTNPAKRIDFGTRDE